MKLLMKKKLQGDFFLIEDAGHHVNMDNPE